LTTRSSATTSNTSRSSSNRTKLAAGELVRVDTGCIVALQASVSYDIEYVGRIGGLLDGDNN
jgi:uncharacterized protein (AIM24 family)